MINLGPHSGGNMPPVYLPPTLIDRIMELLSILLAVAVWVLVILFHSNLQVAPQKLFSPPVIMTVLSVLFLWSSRAPIRFYNFPVRLTERNYVMQLFLARRLSRVVSIIINLLFLCTVLNEAESLFAVKAGLFAMLRVVCIVLIVLSLAVYYFFAFRYK